MGAVHELAQRTGQQPDGASVDGLFSLRPAVFTSRRRTPTGARVCASAAFGPIAHGKSTSRSYVQRSQVRPVSGYMVGTFRSLRTVQDAKEPWQILRSTRAFVGGGGRI